MKERWVVTAKRANFQEIAKKYGIDPVIARVMRNRDRITEAEIQEYLHGTLQEIPSFWKMKDLEKTVRILMDKIKQKRKIRIIGDYDIDGVSATFILLKGLKNAGASVDTYIPDRVLDGYGIHVHLIQKALEDGIDTIITCDNGIAAREEIRYAKEHGMTVLVTDHHEVPYEQQGEEKIYLLPNADAIVNPKQKDCEYPNKNICGAVVAAKVVMGLYEVCGFPEDAWMEFLEVMAMATVGDVMELQGENRILVKEGLRRFKTTKNLGLRALQKACDLEETEIQSYHIGFVLGPCINASGRIATAAASLALLNAETEEAAERLARELRELNVQRQDLTEAGKEAAIRQVEDTRIHEDRVLVVYLPELHESIAGIVAGRLREQYHKPVFVLTKGRDGVKGSGRSIEAYSMYDEMTKCRELFVQYGGHPMAAGLTLKEENVKRFREEINRVCTLTEEDLQPKIVIDVPMPIGYVSKTLVQQLTILEPFGKGNEKPLFAEKNLRVQRQMILGKNQNVLKLDLQDEQGHTMEGICFRFTPEMLETVESKDRISVTYYPKINTFRDQEKLQIVIENIC